MSSAWASATIEQFEQVSLEHDTELLRVCARGHVGDDPEPRPVLTCGPPDDARTYEPLSSGGDRRGLLRVAYAVPSSAAGPSSTFALRLPDGDRIELPRPTPGRSRADAGRGRRMEDLGRRADDVPPRASDAAPEPAPTAHDDASQRIRELEQEHERLAQRLAEASREHATVRSERDEALRGSGAARAQRDAALGEVEAVQAQRDAAVSEADAARAQRDAALGEAETAREQRDEALRRASEAAVATQGALAERDLVIEETASARAEHERLTRRLRQHQARFELLRDDAERTEAAFGAGGAARLRQLEAEHEQIAAHVRALAELTAVNGRPADRDATSNGAAERVAAARDRALQAAHEQAERDLERMLGRGAG